MDRNGRLQINLLGIPEVWLDGVQLTNFSTAKTEALLYYLAVTGQVHSRETLAGLLWSEMPEAKAKRNLTKSLTVLRRLLAPYLLIESQRVGFDPDAMFELDVTRLAKNDPGFEGEITATPEIIDLYRGEFLEGFYVKDAPEFEVWQLSQREFLRELAIELLEALLQQAVNRQDYGAGISHGRRLLTLDPWRESAHRQLMLLLARNGQHGAALAQYEQCCQILDAELGTEPMAETTALFQRIQAARSKPALTLPHEATSLVGREDELAQIQGLLQNPDCRLLTISGLGGVGKTRLALAAAHRINQGAALLFLNGVAFVPLAGVANETAVPLTIANILNTPISSATPPRQALLNFLKNQEMLIVLDNFEHLTGAADLLLELLKNCPEIKLLLTSRNPLNLASEWQLDLEGLPIPPAEEDDRETLSRYAAVALFTRCASQVNKQFRLTEENAAKTGQLCRLVAGIPLALQLAASWLRLMSISAIVAELEHDLDILATDMQDIPPRQRSMRAVFESTWLHLSEDERLALETLSVCRGGFTAEAAAAIAGATPFLLRRIINRALLYRQEESRYDMHPLTRQFAQERLNASGSKETAVAAHGRYYLTWIVNQTPALLGMTPQTTTNTIKKDLDNLEQAWLWAKQARQTDLLLDGLTALTTFCDVVGLLQEGEEIAESVILHATANHPDEELLLCRGLIKKSQFNIEQGKYELAADTLQQALTLAQRLHDEESVADIHHLHGRLLTDTGKYNQAKQQHQLALKIQRQWSDDRKTANTLTNLGWTHIVNDDVEAAFPVLDEALTLERKVGHKHGEAFVKGNLAVAYSIKGEFQTALAIQKEVIAAYEELGDLLNIERAENNLGMTFLGLGQYQEALPHVQRAVAISRQISTVSGLANALDTLGTVYLACGLYHKAHSCLDEALDYALKIGYVYMKYSVRALFVRLFNQTGELAQAEAHLQHLRPLAESLANTSYIARSLAEQAYLTHARGNLKEAVALIRQAIDILRQHSAQPDLPFFLLQYADYLHNQKNYFEALPLVEEALTIANNIQHGPLQIRSNALAANLSITLGTPETAKHNQKAACILLTQCEPYPDVLAGLYYLGRFRLLIGDNQAAKRISAFVASHPSSTFVVRRQAELLWQEITDLPAQDIAQSEPIDWPALVSHMNLSAR